MITFAAPVTRRYAGVPGMRHRGLESNYAPLAAFWNVGRATQPHGHEYEHDPFAGSWDVGRTP
jgi:hypothetical protein